jgi:ribosomal protein L11 methyltransferase
MTWKLTLPCTRSEAEALHDADEQLSVLDPIPSLVTEETQAFNDLSWRMLAYFPKKPDCEAINILHSLIPSASNAKPALEELPDEDWVTLSQQGLAPVQAGRFYVHTQSNKGDIPPNAKCFQIEASQAFGTGGHATTSGCLEMLDRMRQRGQRFDHIVDIGTGTGLLAFAAGHLWPAAHLTASDIDPVSVNATAENADVNSVAFGQSAGKLALCRASGTDHPLIQQRAPYELVIANILAGPLIELAPAFANILGERGSLILAGLLNTQTHAVCSAYRKQGLRLAERRDTGDWPCLRFVKRPQYGWRRPVRTNGRTSQPPGDFGTW